MLLQTTEAGCASPASVVFPVSHTYDDENLSLSNNTSTMKSIYQLLLSVIFCIGCAHASAQHFTNYPIPQQPDTLRILGVGNSFTDDGMMYLPELLEAAGIKNVILGRLYIGGCSLERHCHEYAQNNASYIYYKSTDNHWVTVSKEATLVDGITDEPWDIVVLQQVSGKSGLYETYHPWFEQLVEIVRWYCPNAGACIAWQQTWAYAKTSDHGDFIRYDKNQQRMFDAIVASVKRLDEESSIDIIIPSGTAIQNLRNTELCDSLELTRDGYHLSLKTGRYTAACTWFQALVAPALGTNVCDNPCLLEGTPYALTPKEAASCLQAARKACIRKYEIWKECPFTSSNNYSSQQR